MVFRKYFGELYLTQRCASVFYNTTYDLKDGAKEKPRNWTRAEILCSVSVSERVRPDRIRLFIGGKRGCDFHRLRNAQSGKITDMTSLHGLNSQRSSGNYPTSPYKPSPVRITLQPEFVHEFPFPEYDTCTACVCSFPYCLIYALPCTFVLVLVLLPHCHVIGLFLECVHLFCI